MTNEVAREELTNEEYYDTEIAPVLLELAKKCQDRDMGFVAAVEYGPNDVGRTIALHEKVGIEITLASMAIQADGNIDAFFFAAKRHADKFGHSSMVLHMLGSKEKAD